jgi:HSP20 family protein
MSVTRWDPWGEMLSLREAMNRLLEDSYVRPVGGNAVQSSGNLALDIWQDQDSIEVTAALPGLKPEDVDITIQGDVLLIRAEQKQQTERKQGNYLVRERRSGSFSRAVQLPVMVDADKANAEFQNGVLHLTLPKAESVKPRSIRVQNTEALNAPARVTTSSENGNGAAEAHAGEVATQRMEQSQQ